MLVHTAYVMYCSLELTLFFNQIQQVFEQKRDEIESAFGDWQLLCNLQQHLVCDQGFVYITKSYVTT